ncbi:MAG TPA: hypothetical protein VNX67_00750 [Solirubrobacteraceae bacterium]|nr:hypothetical protein [Solirubrobacteraceae bacterium]
MSPDPAHAGAADDGAARRQAGSSLERLRSLLLAEGGLMANLAGSSPDGHDAPIAGPTELAGPAQLAASGPRVDGRGADYELLVETIYEGYLLHYHAPRVVVPPEEDLGLLAGDRLYALGLARLVELGDIEAVAELADVIALSALAHASSSPELAAAVWTAGARAVGWGASPRYDRAKALLRAGSPDALEALRSLNDGEP